MSVCRSSKGAYDGKDRTKKYECTREEGGLHSIPKMPRSNPNFLPVDNDIYWVGIKPDDVRPVLARLHPGFDLDRRIHQVVSPPGQYRKGDVVYLPRHDERFLDIVLPHIELVGVYYIETTLFKGKKRIKYIFSHGGSAMHPFWVNPDLPRDGITPIYYPTGEEGDSSVGAYDFQRDED